MRTIEAAPLFKRDSKRLKHGKELNMLYEIIGLLLNDQALPASVRDHALRGKLAGFRECHVKPDLLLIYAKDEGVLRLARVGSHSHLFG